MSLADEDWASDDMGNLTDFAAKWAQITAAYRQQAKQQADEWIAQWPKLAGGSASERRQKTCR